VCARGAGRCGSLRVDSRVGLGACAGADSAESDGEEEAAAAEPDGAQVAAEDAEERVHSVALSFRDSCLVVGCVFGSGSSTVAKGRRVEGKRADGQPCERC
jgi:hypothetical protein